MDTVDPYYPVQEEVIKNLQTIKHVYNEWLSTHPSKPELINSLKQLTRGIEWDLEDIQETISIAQNDPLKYHLSEHDFSERERFVREVKDILQRVKNQVDSGNKRLSEPQISFAVTTAKALDSSAVRKVTVSKSKLSNSNANVQTAVIEGRTLRPTVLPVPTDPLSHQELLLQDQDDRLDKLGTSISTLKGMSRMIGDELSDQVALLDEFSGEMVHTESRLDAVTKRTARLLHLGTDRRQWYAIGGLTLALFIIIILLVIL